MKSIKLDRKDFFILSFLLVSVLFLSYELISDNSISERDIIYYTGMVKGEPEIGQNGGDIKYEYLEVELININEPFRFKECSFLNMDSDRAMSLQKGDSVKIGTIERKGLKYNQSVTFTKLDGSKPFLKLTSVNYCEQSQWKKALLLVIALVVILGVRFVKKYQFS